MSQHSSLPRAGRHPQEVPDVARRRVAYTELVAKVEASLLRTARRLCNGNEDQAQDLVQETLVRGYQAYIAGRFQEGTNARAWLFKILTNSFLSEYRRRRWDAGVDIDTLTAEGEVGPEALQAASADCPEIALLTGTLDEPLERALAALSEELRACVVLVDIEEMEYAEAATTLEIPIGTVRSRLSRARRQMHTFLSHYAREQK